MILPHSISGSQLALYFLLILPCLFYAMSPFLTAVFGSDTYFAHLDLVEETSILDTKAKILELEIQKAVFTVQALQIDLQKANITAMVEMQKAEIVADVEVQLMREKMKLEIQKSSENERMMMEKIRLEEGNKQLYFSNLHAEEDDKIKRERYREHRLLLDTMVRAQNCNECSGQGFVTRFLKEDK